MARNSSGTYSAPIAPFVTGTVIRSNDVNTYLQDLGAEITKSLSRDGDGGMRAPLELTDGSAAIPSLTFGQQPGIGFYRAGNYDLRFVTDAAEKFRLTNAGAKVTGTLEVTGASTLAGTTASTLSVTGTGTIATAVVTGDLTVDTSTLKVDATNNRVGVGTASPSCLLAVGHAGVVDAGIPVQINAAAAGEQYFSTNKGGSLGFLVGYSNGGTYGTRAMLRNVPNDPLSIYVNGSSHVAEFHTTGVRLYTSNPASSTSQTNNLTTKNIPKALALVTINGGGGVSLDDGFNITSVVIAASVAGFGNVVKVTFASAFATSTFMPSVSHDNPQPLGRLYQTGARTTTTVEIVMTDVAGAYLNPSTNAGGFMLTVYGAQ